jgi:hypothetical protein
MAENIPGHKKLEEYLGVMSPMPQPRASGSVSLKGSHNDAGRSNMSDDSTRRPLGELQV